MKIFVGLAATALAISTAASSHAATLFTNAPDLVVQGADCIYSTTCGANYGNVFAAQLFTLGSTSTVTGFGFNAIVFGVFGTAANYRILSSAGGAPGAVIASGTAPLSNAVGPTGSSFPTTNYTFNAVPIQLSAGNYFLAFQNVTTNFNDFLSKGEGPTGAFLSNDGGVSYSAGYRGSSSVAVSVFDDVVAPAVPEPATWALMLLGFGMVGFASRRQRSKVSTKVSFV